MRAIRQNARAFIDAFIDAFGNGGQGCDPVIGGVSVLKDAGQPVTLNLHRFRQTASASQARVSGKLATRIVVKTKAP